MSRWLSAMYHALYDTFGPRHWWPAETPWEVIVGAILTQNTSWKNVEKAIANLKRTGLLSPSRLRNARPRTVAQAIRSAGYFNVKTRRLKHMVDTLYTRHQGDVSDMLSSPTQPLRDELLSIHGIGPETADSILLYAAGKPVFVIDAYTRRVFERHGVISEDTSYPELQALLMRSLPHRTKLFNEYHALLVEVGKEFCKNLPECERCPLRGLWKSSVPPPPWR